MDQHKGPNRRDFLVRTAGVAGTVSALAGSTSALAQTQTCPPVPVIDPAEPLANYWEKRVCELGTIVFPDELSKPPVMERHQIYCLLLMKLIHRFWNGNKFGPIGTYPFREAQKEDGQSGNGPFRYRGDMFESSDPQRVSWNRYVGHNIACLAVDGKGEIIDFEFNHNAFFRSSAEHAESRMVRRLFSLANVFDKWKTGEPLPGKSRAASLSDVTLYTSLESCAQCSGVMSLANVKQVVYLQRDYLAFVIGNIMFNLAPKVTPFPIPASQIGLEYYDRLNQSLKDFNARALKAERENNKQEAFFIPPNGGKPLYAGDTTSYLCTDDAFRIFSEGGDSFDKLVDGRLRLTHGDAAPADPAGAWNNQKCLDEAGRFYKYADVEGYRGSPHKL
jgi:tRNA(Arg) A34 adenosine deaminase TadA